MKLFNALLFCTSLLLAGEVEFYDVKFDAAGKPMYFGKKVDQASQLEPLKAPKRDLCLVDAQESLAVTFKQGFLHYRVFADTYDGEASKGSGQYAWEAKAEVPNFEQLEVCSEFKRYQDQPDLTYPEINTKNSNLRTLLYMLHSSATFKHAIYSLAKLSKSPLPASLGALATALNSLDNGHAPYTNEVDMLEYILQPHVELDKLYEGLIMAISKDIKFAEKSSSQSLLLTVFLPLCMLRVAESSTHVVTGWLSETKNDTSLKFDYKPVFHLSENKALTEVFSGDWNQKEFACPAAHKSCKLRTEHSSNTPEYMLLKVGASQTDKIDVQSKFQINGADYFVSMIINGEEMMLHDINSKEWKQISDGKLVKLNAFKPEIVRIGAFLLAKRMISATEIYRIPSYKRYKISSNPVPRQIVYKQFQEEPSNGGLIITIVSVAVLLCVTGGIFYWLHFKRQAISSPQDARA